MRNNLFGVLMLLLCLVGGVAVFRHRVSLPHHLKEERMNPIRYSKYLGTPTGLLANFEYPEGWLLHEEQGQAERYKQVRITGPRNREDSYSCYFAVQEFPLKTYGGVYQNAEEILRRYTEHLPEGAHTIVNRAPLSGLPAIDVLASYTSRPWHHQGMKAVEVPIAMRVIIVQKGPYLYQLNYSADARESEQYAEAFDHLAHTFRPR